MMCLTAALEAAPTSLIIEKARARTVALELTSDTGWICATRFDQTIALARTDVSGIRRLFRGFAVVGFPRGHPIRPARARPDGIFGRDKRRIVQLRVLQDVIDTQGEHPSGSSKSLQ